MYEYLIENLISYSQVDGNLRRTADRGLISELYRKQMNALALKYFGVDSLGNFTENKDKIVAYRCPYSGEIINDLSKSHLEHILPVSSNGGTVLFNCIPVLDEVNLSKRDEPNLLAWWQEQDYFNYDRLERLIKYMLEAYTLAFKEPSDDELYDYVISQASDEYIENDDLSKNLKSKSSKRIKSSQSITYYQLLTDMINELSKNRDVSKYNETLNDLKIQNVFGNIDEIEKVIYAVQSVFKEVLEEDSKRYLSYSLKIDMNKLLKSLKTNNYKQEIKERFIYINNILNENNISLFDYFDNLQDIDEINLIYYMENQISYEKKQEFINNLKIGHNTKINFFINMLMDANSKYLKYENGVPTKNNIFRSDNDVIFVGNNNIKVGQYWSHYKHEIKKKIEDEIIFLRKVSFRTKQEEEKLKHLKKALKEIDKYEFTLPVNIDKRIDQFIKMLMAENSRYTKYKNGVPDDNNIFGFLNKVPFMEYEDINGLNTSHFWRFNKIKIKAKIENKIYELETKKIRTEYEEETLKKFKKALSEIKKYEFSTNLDMRINQFIKMLMAENSRYTKYKNGNPDDNNIFGQKNKIPFDEYEDIEGLNTSQFWSKHSQNIKKKIEDEILFLSEVKFRTKQEEDKLKHLKKALKEIDKYEFTLQVNIDKRIDQFIKMLMAENSRYTKYKNGVPDDNNIFGKRNKIPFDEYEDIDGLNTSNFWYSNKVKIIGMLFYNKYYDSSKKTYFDLKQKYNCVEYNSARSAVMEYLNSNRRRKKQPEFKSIDEYIDTLDKTKKEVKELIELRDSLRIKKEQLLIENQELNEELNSSYRRAM